MLLDEEPPLRERQHKVQEQRRLQHPGNHVAPVNAPVERVQFPGVVERVEDERDQAENIEMRRTGRRPPAQQNVHANAEINQRDQPQPIVQRPVRRCQNDSRLNRYRMPDDRVRCFRPGTGCVKLPFERRSIFHLAPVNGSQLVALPNACFVRRTVPFHAVRYQMPAAFYPPRSVGRNLKFVLFLEVDPGKSAGGGSQQEQQAGSKADLEVLVHGLVGRYQRVQPR